MDSGTRAIASDETTASNATHECFPVETLHIVRLLQCAKLGRVNDHLHKRTERDRIAERQLWGLSKESCATHVHTVPGKPAMLYLPGSS